MKPPVAVIAPTSVVTTYGLVTVIVGSLFNVIGPVRATLLPLPSLPLPKALLGVEMPKGAVFVCPGVVPLKAKLPLTVTALVMTEYCSLT